MSKRKVWILLRSNALCLCGTSSTFSNASECKYCLSILNFGSLMYHVISSFVMSIHDFFTQHFIRRDELSREISSIHVLVNVMSASSSNCGRLLARCVPSPDVTALKHSQFNTVSCVETSGLTRNAFLSDSKRLSIEIKERERE